MFEDDDFDYQPQQFAAVAPPMSAAPPPPFTQADALRLQKLGNGIDHVQEKIENGTMDPQDGEAWLERVRARQAPLLARQQLTQEAAKASALNDIREQGALAQGMAQSDAEFRARNFPNRVTAISHPLTGEMAFFYDDGNGFQPIDFGGGEGMPEGADMVSADLPPGQPEPSAGQQAMGQGDNTLTIYNGARRSEFDYQGGRGVAERHYNPIGLQVERYGDERPNMSQERAAGQGGGQFGISEERMNLLGQQAWHASGGNQVAYRQIMRQLVQKDLQYQLQVQRQAETARLFGSRQRAQEQAKADREQVKTTAEQEKADRFDEAAALRSAQAEAKASRAEWANMSPKQLSEAPEYGAAVMKAYEKRRGEHDAKIAARRGMIGQAAGANLGAGDVADAGPAEKPTAKQARETPMGDQPPLVKQRMGVLDSMEQALNRPDLSPQQQSEAKGALAKLREMMAAHGGNLAAAPSGVQAEAKKLIDKLKGMKPPQTESEYLRSQSVSTF